MVAAVKEFFDSGFILPAANCTLVTLVPKVPNSTYVREFRLIACCTVQTMMSEIVDLGQAGLFMGEISLIIFCWLQS